MLRCSNTGILSLGILIWFAISVAASATSTVTGVRFGADGERTRIVIDIDVMVDVVARTLTSPPRLVVDMPAVKWELRDHPQNRPRGFVTAFRYGLVNGDRSRLVVDMAGNVEIKSQQNIPAGRNDIDYARIVIDVVPAAAGESAPPSEPPRSAPPVIDTDDPDRSNQSGAQPPVPIPVPRPTTTIAGGAASAPLSTDRPIIALDAGHGGIDPGAIAKDGTFEKNITLAMSRELAGLLERSGRYEAFLVRDDDSFIKLRDRIARARAGNADVFVSVHADSISDRGLRGASIYTLSENASDREAANLATKENKADIIGGTDLSRADDVLASILIDLSQRSTNNESIKLADLLVEEIGEVTKLVRNTRRFAGFAVLKAPDMPSVLVELGYLSNASDAERLSQRTHRAELGRAILRALDRYFSTQTGDG